MKRSLVSNTENWPPVDTSDFSVSKLKKFRLRKKALDLSLTSESTLEQISLITKLSVSEIKRIRERALSIDENGNNHGYLACVPNLNLVGYKRTNSLMRSGGGRFTFFLEKHPNICEHLNSWALGHSTPNHVGIRGRFYKRIYLAFRELCVHEGINESTEYPFTNKDMGQGAIRSYCIALKNRHFIQAAKVDFGDFSAKLCTNSLYSKSSIKSPRPYEIVQLDGHRVDSEITIKLLDEYGNIQYVPLSRIWLLTLIDTASRAVLGYSISLSQNYSSEDVMFCIASAIAPSSDSLPGLPATEIEECQGRIFNCIKFDNAYAHTSGWLQEKLIEIGVQEVITNRPGRPRSNAIVERFFKTLEEKSFHQFPTTTGSHIKDSRRRKPQKAAENLAIGLEDIENTIKLTVEWYNHSPHTSLNGRSPIEFLKYAVNQKADLTNTIVNIGESAQTLFRRQYPVTIRGNKSQGHLPYIQFTNARYMSMALSGSPNLIGEKAIFEVDIRDIRKGRLFISGGRLIDEVTVSSQWAVQKHSLRDRRAIVKLAREKKIKFEGKTPLTKYTEFLAERSLTNRRERNEYIKVNRNFGYENGISKTPENNLKITSDRNIKITKISNVR